MKYLLIFTMFFLLSCNEYCLVVEVKSIQSYDGPYYIIKYEDNYHFGHIEEYYENTNITNWYAIDDKDTAIALAKHFDTYEKIKHWQDSVENLKRGSIKTFKYCK